MGVEWSGINALLYYGPLLMERIGLEGDLVSLVMSGFINIVQLVSVVPAMFLLDSVGRKPLLRGKNGAFAGAGINRPCSWNSRHDIFTSCSGYLGMHRRFEVSRFTDVHPLDIHR